jgi:hypothetical protein
VTVKVAAGQRAVKACSSGEVRWPPRTGSSPSSTSNPWNLDRTTMGRLFVTDVEQKYPLPAGSAG